jgi:hypothetical protein
MFGAVSAFSPGNTPVGFGLGVVYQRGSLGFEAEQMLKHILIFFQIHANLLKRFPYCNADTDLCPNILSKRAKCGTFCKTCSISNWVIEQVQSPVP